jgi:hypothetical protein
MIEKPGSSERAGLRLFLQPVAVEYAFGRLILAGNWRSDVSGFFRFALPI